MLAETVTPAQELNALLSHPLLLAFASILAAWLASRVVHEQVRKMNLEQPGGDGRPGFGWSAFFASLTFWAVLCLGLLGIAAHIELSVVGRFLEAGFDLLLRAILAGAILAATGAFGSVLAEPLGQDVDPRTIEAARRERRTILIIGGVLAVTAATGLSLGTWIFLALIGIPAALLLRNASYRAKAAAVLSDLAAGMRLREQFRDGSVLSRGGRSVRISGKVGALKTWALEAGRRRLLRNEELMLLTEPTEGAAPESAARAPEAEEAASPAEASSEAEVDPSAEEVGQ